MIIVTEPKETHGANGHTIASGKDTGRHQDLDAHAAGVAQWNLSGHDSAPGHRPFGYGEFHRHNQGCPRPGHRRGRPTTEVAACHTSGSVSHGTDQTAAIRASLAYGSCRQAQGETQSQGQAAWIGPKFPASYHACEASAPSVPSVAILAFGGLFGTGLTIPLAAAACAGAIAKDIFLGQLSQAGTWLQYEGGDDDDDDDGDDDDDDGDDGDDDDNDDGHNGRCQSQLRLGAMLP